MCSSGAAVLVQRYLAASASNGFHVVLVACSSTPTGLPWIARPQRVPCVLFADPAIPCVMLSNAAVPQATAAEVPRSHGFLIAGCLDCARGSLGSGWFLPSRAKVRVSEAQQQRLRLGITGSLQLYGTAFHSLTAWETSNSTATTGLQLVRSAISSALQWPCSSDVQMGSIV